MFECLLTVKPMIRINPQKILQKSIEKCCLFASPLEHLMQTMHSTNLLTLMTRQPTCIEPSIRMFIEMEMMAEPRTSSNHMIRQNTY